MTAAQPRGARAGRATPRRAPAFSRILCAVDGTRASYTAVKQAATLAGPNRRLTLLTVTAVGGSGLHKHAAITPARAERILDRAGTVAEELGVRSSKVVDPGSPVSQVILERASRHDLLAIGAPAASWLGGAMIGGVGATALGSFTTPLLAARAVRGGRHFARRVVVASDGSHASDHVVAFAARVARSQNAKLTLLHAVGAEGRARPRRIHEQARTLELAVEGQSEVRIEAGRARGVIVETARSARASLVVMGSRRLEGLRALGSVSRRVVHDAHCSVLLLPPEDSRA